MATQRQVTFLISANAEGFSRGMKNAQRTFQRVGRRMERMGQSLTQNVTVPLAAAGAASGKFASDFETSLKQASAQADLTSNQVEKIGDIAEKTAMRTGESTADIIEAYKFTVSAGFNVAESQEVVGAAAEASASGFGKQRDLVRVATTAMQAYSEELDSGREFMDLLVGAGQKMELEVSKLGPAFQRNVGVAKELGVGIDQLLAGIGSVSEIMGDADRGGRMFQTMMSKILQPTKEAQGNIKNLYGSLDAFHQTIRDQGLLQTMVDLRQRLEEAGMGMEDVFTGQEGLEAALNFTNRAGDRTNEILKQMGDTAGSTNDAFEKSSDFVRDLSRTYKTLKATLRPVGNILMDAIRPMLDDVRVSMKGIADNLKTVNPSTIRFGVAIAAAAAAVGPLLVVLGKLTLGLSALMSPTLLAQAALTALFTSVVVTGQWFIDNWNKIEQDFANVMESITIATQMMVKDFITAIKRLLEFVINNSNPITQVSKLLGFDLGEFSTELVGFDKAIKKLDNSIKDGRDTLKKGIQDYRDMEWGSIGDAVSSALEKTKDSIVNGLKGVLNSDQIQGLIDKINGMVASSVSGSGGMAGMQGFNQMLAIDPNLGQGMRQQSGGFNVMGGAFRNVGNEASQLMKQVKGHANKSFRVMGDALTYVGNSSKKLVGSLTQTATAAKVLNPIADRFVNSFGQGMANIVVQGEKLADVLKNIGKLLLSSAIQRGIGLLLTGGLPGVSGFFGKGGGLFGRIFGVDDALITSQGDVVKFHPDDNILAMKDFSNMPVASGGGGGRNINLSGQFRVRGTDLVMSLEQAQKTLR